MNRSDRILLCSTGTMVGRLNGYDYKTASIHLETFMDQGLISGAEFMMLPVYYQTPDIVIKAFTERGVVFPVMHADKDIGTMLSRKEGDDVETAMGLFRRNCSICASAGAKKLVLHLWGGSASDSDIEFNISLLDSMLDECDMYGIKLLCENIPCTTKDPLTHWRSMKNYLPRLGFIYDTRFGKFHEQSREILTDGTLWDGNAVRHIHISDYNGGYKNFEKLRPILHPGEGDVDFEYLAERLDYYHYSESITLESPVMFENGLNIAKISETLSYLKKLLID